MKNKKIIIAASLAVLGAALVVIGIIVDFESNINGAMLGVGAGLLGAALSQLITNKIYSKNPEMLKQKAIEVNDERNVIIKDKAKSATYKIFTYIFSAVILSLLFTGLKPIWIYAAVALYIIRFVIEIFFISKYANEL